MQPPEQTWLSSVLVGQAIATVCLLLYAAFVGPLVAHDGVGGFIFGLLIGAIIEGYCRARWGLRHLSGPIP